MIKEENNSISKFIEQMPKIELHVHLEGSVRPEILIKLAEKNGIELPYTDPEKLKEWYAFTNFDHFLKIYFKISECIKTAEDIELVAKEFLLGQKEQNIIYTEITFTPYTHYIQKGITFAEQLSALERARAWGEEQLGVYCNFIFDISRNVTAEEGLITAKWLVENNPPSVVALGLGGPELGFPPERHKKAFDLVRGSRLVAIPHAGETAGAESIWGAINNLNAIRIGHGVRAVEDPELIDYLRNSAIVLEVCPSSNVCLGVFDNIEKHSLPELVEAGIKVTINSDDPPMFNTSLIEEYKLINKVFGFGIKDFYKFNKTALAASQVNEEIREKVKRIFEEGWLRLR